jgi:hypothetical protein
MGGKKTYFWCNEDPRSLPHLIEDPSDLIEIRILCCVGYLEFEVERRLKVEGGE